MASYPKHFYGFWPELEEIEVGRRAAIAYDEAFAIQRRLVNATGEPLVLMQQVEWQRARYG